MWQRSGCGTVAYLSLIVIAAVLIGLRISRSHRFSTPIAPIDSHNSFTSKREGHDINPVHLDPQPRNQELPWWADDLLGEWEGREALRRYEQVHRDIMEGRAPRRFVAVSARHFRHSGMGNRMLGAVSIFYFAVVTRRAFVVLDEPITSVWEPNSETIDWRVSQDFFTEQEWNSKQHIVLAITVDEDLGCKNVSELWSDRTVITMESSQYFVPLLSHNPYLRESMLQDFGPSHEFFTFAIRFLFQPIRVIRDLAQPLLSKMSDHYTVGLQIRSDFLTKERTVEEMGYILNCGRWLSQSKRRRRRGLPSSDRPTLYLIATDKSEWFDTIRAMILKQEPSSTVDRYALKEHAGMVDMYLLSRCDDLVITWPKSTFGQVSVGLGGKTPYAMVSGSNKRNTCVKLLNTEPRFHGWHRRRLLSCYSSSLITTPAGAWSFEGWDTINDDNSYICNRPRCCPCNDDTPSEVHCPNAQDCPLSVIHI